jgi:hypothetical protein
LVPPQLNAIRSPSANHVIVPDRVRKCVFFVGYKMADGSMRFAGSGFFIGKEAEDGTVAAVFLVTARHVIDGIRALGLTEVFIRGNTNAGQTAWAKCSSTDWLFHPTDSSVDVAILRGGIPSNWDHLIISTAMCVTPDVMRKHEVSLGDELFIIGLFRHHYGLRKNIPIVRVGNLAATTEEKVSTKSFGLVDAYLIEARSIGGLSGSPVFLNLGVVRYIEKEVRNSNSGPIFYLLGLVHGHYDVANTAVDHGNQVLDGGLGVDQINTGIAIVVPIEKVVEVIEAHAKTVAPEI